VKIGPSTPITSPSTAARTFPHDSRATNRRPAPQITPGPNPFASQRQSSPSDLNLPASTPGVTETKPLGVFEPWEPMDDPEQFKIPLKPWQSSTTYPQGSYVEYKGDVYQAIETVRSNSSLIGNSDFRLIETTQNEEYLKRVGSVEDQLNKNDRGPVIAPSNYPLGSEEYDPNKSYERGQIVTDKETGMHFIAANKTTPRPDTQQPPDKNPSFQKVDHTQPPGNTLSTVTHPDGTTEKVPFAQRVQQTMQRVVPYLKQAITAMQQPWSTELQQKMDTLFPGISKSQAGKDMLTNEFRIQLEKMEKSIQSGFKDISYFHQYEYNLPVSASAGFTDLRDGSVHLNVDETLSDDALDRILLHEFSHASVLSRDFSYIDDDGVEVREGGWGPRKDQYPDWPWHNADSLALGALVLAGVKLAPNQGADDATVNA
jgi:hypothetical protein